MKQEEVIKRLKDNKDKKYKEFNDKIIVTNYETIGVRMPILKQIAKDIMKGNYNIFLDSDNRKYYELLIIEGVVISKIKYLDELIERLECYIDKIDSWAFCDSLVSSLKIVSKNKDIFFKIIDKYLKSSNNWRQRFAYVLLLNYYIEDKYLDYIFKKVEENKNDYYYVMMAKAWLISICYIKYPKETYNYLIKTKIDNITFNKIISKICDSYRVDKKNKEELKKMKKKKNFA